MTKILLAFFFLTFTIQSFGQQFSQYNTGTLYDSFENNAQRSFIPDSSRQYASNFFLPNFYLNFNLSGNAQVPLKSRAFNGNYVKNNLRIGNGNFTNQTNTDINYYLFMFKAYTNLAGDAEIGISAQTRFEMRGIFTDESVAIFNGPSALPQNHYDNIFNNSGTYQAYHQLSFTYREKINKRFALGAKLSLLMGIRYQNVDIRESHIDIDRPNDLAVLSMRGKYLLNYIPGGFTTHDYIPNLRNPGAAISIGSTVRTNDNFNLQFNLKDLGFIHWSSRSYTYNFDRSDTIKQFSSAAREKNIYNAAKSITKNNVTTGSFVTPTNSKFEISANKVFWLDYDNQLKYSPTLIVSKELFFKGLAAALVNPVSYNNYTLTLTTSYNNYKTLSVGGQFMFKTPNVEFFVGSEKLFQTTSLAFASTGSSSQINDKSSYTGASLFLGAAFKFGHLIEHPLNASSIPNENNPGFLKRLYLKIFRRNEGY
ncbi:hypothetical protein A0256_16190 [Mucilaginibacter sp. PAMC 26640]|nr:hypothetical protein A0256_16190 [Mucilaginibacter sp. PAMC 26640]